ncbi:gastrula zinc finger protein XlCGF57.1-like isoform X1 [Periplaneta americana]|uniref:gastrula zinc finger protein XlCGF57.1-like isoform X1 n=1 Tax=Periplaneta americana TaxID=6978 RepID=UPI0037E867E2
MDLLKEETDCCGESTSWTAECYDVKQKIDPLSVVKCEAEDEPNTKPQVKSSSAVSGSEQILVKHEGDISEYLDVKIEAESSCNDQQSVLKEEENVDCNVDVMKSEVETSRCEGYHFMTVKPDDHAGSSQKTDDDETSPQFTHVWLGMKKDVTEDVSALPCSTKRNTVLDSCTSIEKNAAVHNASERQLPRYPFLNEGHYGSSSSHSIPFNKPTRQRSEVGHTHVQGVTYKCDTCGEWFARKEEYLTHIRIHRLEYRFSCETCGKGFWTKSTYLAHVRIHTGEKPYSCDICEKSFRKSANLALHLRVHSGKKPFKCESCGKAFCRRMELVRHSRIHTGEKPYKCDFCGKGFAEIGNLTTHVRVHTGEKPYNCETCGKGFSKRGNLLTHARIHSGEKPFSCTVCDKNFSQYGHLSAHLRIHKRREALKAQYSLEAVADVENSKSSMD